MNAENFMGKMFGKIAPGMCRLSMSGKIAVKTESGYKSFDVKTKKLTNCNNFVFDIGEDFFFVIPTNKVETGDIILASGKPKCVLEASKNEIRVMNYEDSTIETLIPERHIFMGNTYFYGKIVSMFGNGFKGKNGTNNIMKYMMMSEMMKGSNSNNAMSSMLPLMMMGGNTGTLFDGMFDLDCCDADEDTAEEEVNE